MHLHVEKVLASANEVTNVLRLCGRVYARSKWVLVQASRPFSSDICPLLCIFTLKLPWEVCLCLVCLIIHCDVITDHEAVHLPSRPHWIFHFCASEWSRWLFMESTRFSRLDLYDVSRAASLICEHADVAGHEETAHLSPREWSCCVGASEVRRWAAFAARVERDALRVLSPLIHLQLPTCEFNRSAVSKFGVK